MDLKLKDKVVLVTGGSHGLGRAICLGLAAEGAKVGVNYHRNPEKADAVVAEIQRTHGVAAAGARGDIAKEADVIRMFDDLEQQLGSVDVVVNNAASGYVKALQHLMYGAGAYHASDLAETNFANVANAMGVRGIRVEDPSTLAAAIATGLAGEGPTVIDLVVTRDPAKMLPAVDNRAVTVKKGDRVA